MISRFGKHQKRQAYVLAFLMAAWCFVAGTAVAQAKTYYVTPTGADPTEMDNAWTGVITLGQALERAQPGDEIWVQGFEQITNLQTQMYVVPSEGAHAGGFVLKSGVKLYGGFKGNEISLDERATSGEAYRFTYRSVLSADRQTGASSIDKIDPALLIYPGSPTRTDNAPHVLQLQLNAESWDNANAYRTEVDGFTIVGGHAVDANGGGIWVQGGEYSTSYTIRRCFFFNNYAQQGGAVYVDADAGRGYTADESYINQCVVYNNVAGDMVTVSNNGAGIYLAGSGTIVNTAVFNNENGGVRISPEASIVNSTIVRNTAAGVDLIGRAASDGEQHVVNTVIWGNTALYAEYNPGFSHSAYHEVTAADVEHGNVYVSDKNNDGKNPSPFFESPSTRTSFDRTFDWQYNAYPLWTWNILEGSAFVGEDKGDAAAYDSGRYGSSDLRGDAWGTDVNIGAYKLVTVPADRILRVNASSPAVSPDGKTWKTAYHKVQDAINELARSKQPGEVWVAHGTYEPSELMVSGENSTAAFVMKDGISVYGGFNGTEDSRAERGRPDDAMPWKYNATTVFKGSSYEGECTWNSTDKKWNVVMGASSHVVWFAPTDGSSSFTYPTVLEGVTIKGGRASTANAGILKGDKGAGVYMSGNAELMNCVVTENQADGEGGAVYLTGGRVTGSLVYNNEASKGGGVYMEQSGLVLRSVLSNNSAQNGAAVYMKSESLWSDGQMHPEYLILSTSVVSHNTSRKNGAVYCDRGGVVLQSTLANNLSTSVKDDADKTTAQTGGLYMNDYGLVVNSVCWNNRINGADVPMYAMNASVEDVRFYNTAFSGMNNAIWNNTLQQELLSLSEENTGTDSEGLVTPDFTVVDGFDFNDVGVQGGWKDITYYWVPRQGSNLRAGGMVLGAFPTEIVLSPELDLWGNLFAQKPGMGAVKIDPIELMPESKNGVMRLYVDVECTTPEHDGRSWDEAYRSLNEAIAYFAGLPESSVLGVDSFEIWVCEGDCHPRYGFVNLDPKSATIDILKTPKPLTIRGGYSRQTREWNPLQYRTVVDGNYGGSTLEEGVFHCMTVGAGAEVVIDGFHVVGGYAAGNATYKQGAGLMMRDGARVTVRNSIFENHTALDAAAIFGEDGSDLTLENCVINNNTNTTETNPVIKAGKLEMRHVTVVNNIGEAPTGAVYGTSFSAGNSAGDSQVALRTVGEEGAKNFANPTNRRGATLGYDTYLGGYSEFRPLTSSTDAGTTLINKAGRVGDISKDISGRGRDLGGMPDLGAYEADLPESGRVIYVREYGTGNGLSWEDAMGSINGAVNKALAYNNELSDEEKKDADKRAQVWVAAGTYAEDPVDNGPACFIIKEGVDVLGGFPASGCPGVDDRRPLVSQEIYTGMRADSVKMYETILLPLSMLSVDRPVAEGQGNYYYNSTGDAVYVPADKDYVEYVYLEGTYKRFATYDTYVGRWYSRRYFIQVGNVDIAGVQKYTLSQPGTTNGTATADDNGNYIEWPEKTGYYPVSSTVNGTLVERSGYYIATDYPLSTATHVKVEPGQKVEVGQGYGNWLKSDGISGMPQGTRLRVLSQEDKNNPRIFVHSGSQINETKYVKGEDFKIPTMWDGFTITKGRLDIGSSQFNGGAGARIFNNVTLQNCIVTDNWNTPVINSGDREIRGGGVYCYGGTMVNCYIQKNRMGCVNTNGEFNNSGVAYGGGIYTAYSTLYNCIIAENEINAQYADGAGVCMEVGEFYNNTVLQNNATGSNRACGGIRLWVGVKTSIPGTVKIYNTISYGNTGWNSANNGNGMQGNANFSESGVDVDFVNGLIQTGGTDAKPGSYATLDNLGDDGNWQQTAENRTINIRNSIDLKDVDAKDIFQDYANGNYRLKGQYGLNRGLNEIKINRVQMPKPNETYGDHLTDDNGRRVTDGSNNGFLSGTDYVGKPCVWYSGTTVKLDTLPSTVDLFDYTDMDYTDRVKDCTVDAGAYERRNEDMVEPDADGVYYVTFNGNGTANASSPTDAACAMKLQEVLNVAGSRAAQGLDAIVKIAGYQGGVSAYHPNTLSDPDDPKSYTFVIPEGVTVMGGYNEGSYANGEYVEGSGNWNQENRNAAEYMTVLSAVSDAAGGRQEVNGYHAVQFGTGDGTVALNKSAILDGVYLENGKATSMAGKGIPEAKGGGAIVPKGAHVRNCVVRNNEAIEGGGLYVLPGGMVSGCGVMQNKAETGAGIYISQNGEMMDADNRSHLMSCTVAGNTATGTGGGIYLEHAAGLTANTVVWGNRAQSDKNISGVTGETYEDELFTKAATGENTTSFYPFNNCYVETYEMPGNYGNTPMTAVLEDYFDSDYYTPRAFSPLVKGGAAVLLQNTLHEHAGVSVYDMQGIARVSEYRNGNYDPIDAGAYAREGGTMRMPQNANEIIRRIFVSQTANSSLLDGESEEVVMGRSFQTSLSTLDDALEYITKVRALNLLGVGSTTFEIWMSGGTYKPRKTRQGVSAGVEPSQRQNSFVIPDGVKVFGGFSGEENYAYMGSGTIDGNLNASRLLEDVTSDNVAKGKLENRLTADLSGNLITEPWEFNTPTILSGDVNLSEEVKNVYHVVYSTAGTAPLGGVTLDGLTVMDGETYNHLGYNDELGRGGGIYTNGVDYTLSRCRLLNNKAIRGGAVFALDAKVRANGSVFAGNCTVEEPVIDSGTSTTENLDVRGGAVYLAATDITKAGLYAVNTLWANNEASGDLNSQSAKGGAIATSSEGVPVDLMNNTIVRNKAGEYGAVYAPRQDNSGGLRTTNTVVWGNVSETNSAVVMSQDAEMFYTACDVFAATELENENLRLEAENKALDGPRFEAPSAVAGRAGFIWDARWNPSGISLLVDAGNSTDEEQGHSAYEQWVSTHVGGDDPYMQDMGYERFAGPKDEESKDKPKVIDIGLYEYQYPSNLESLDAVYVAMDESGNGSGDSWDNATSDLRGALVAMSNPALASTTNRAVYIKAGNYNMRTSLVLGNDKKAAYWINVSEDNDAVSTLTVEGSYNEAGKQDFSQPTVVSISPTDSKEGTVLLDIKTESKAVTATGLSLQGAGLGVQVAGGTGKLTLKNVAFRDNHTGASLSKGNMLIANALFADGQMGLTTEGGTTTVVNATFAHNELYGIGGTADVYNSVGWKNGSTGFTKSEDNKNVVFAGDIENNDIEKGPNFMDPENAEKSLRDYRFRPNMTLLNKGSNDLYAQHVLGSAASSLDAEKDLADIQRVVETIDVGAYEYASPLRSVIYVKSGVAGSDNSGQDWANAMSDLQSAADLAAVYASGNTGQNGYVFVHRNVTAPSVSISRGGVKMYGGMDNETGADADAVLKARKGILEDEGCSILGSAAIQGNSVVDGFEVTGQVSVSAGGVLSTSVISGSGNTVTVSDGGFLYNSIVDGATVTGDGKVVNVTAVNSGVLPETSVNSVGEGTDNGYGLDGYWKFQLKDDAGIYINHGIDTEAQACIAKVGHSFDMAGNLRIRNTVDFGCFETWNIEGAPADVTDGDYPRGQSVVYVREGSELRLQRDYDRTEPFNPGFLLLEHGAGLWGNGKRVGLRNFAAERKLTATNGYKDLVAMPFSSTEMTVNGNKGLEASNVKAYKYNGLERAKYDYKFASEDSKAWQDVSTDWSTVTEGLLFEAQGSPVQDVKLRFYGTSYQEDGQPKNVVLHKYNFNSPWSSPSDTGDKFTHKENMSWNLFGSPYLCTMNYEDMEYGRVIYGYANNGYYTDGMEADGERTRGNIPVGSAVFTQSATLKETETFTVDMRKEDIHENTRSTKLALYVASASGKRGLEENDGIYDELQLTAVPSEEASTEFDLACDGVKWMNDNGEPEIFAVRDGGRYSLLSAIDREGTIGVGVSLPEAGMYSIGIPEGCEAEDYEYVMLKDAATGKAADLKEGAYSFRTAEAGVAEGRFTLSFKRMDADQRHAIYVKSGMGKATVFGVNDGDVVTVVTVDGKVVAVEEAVGSEVTFALAKGAYLFKVAGADGRTTVVKAMVR